MFKFIIFCLMTLLLFLATSATLYLGVFKAGKPGAGVTRKFFSGLAASFISVVFWYGAYGYTYLGW
jgi:hypothetical protein